MAIGHHGRTGISRFFRGDISGGITRLTARPVLLINFQNPNSPG
ncbi:MAG: universal stress protein [Ignavibacteria bacterium]|nr:universal stress protein [Ignavibacteria bacterium]